MREPSTGRTTAPAQPFRAGRFALAFAGILVALFAAELTRPIQHALVAPWTDLVARASAAMLRAFDRDVVASDATIFSASTGFGITIRAGCNGVEAMLVLAAAMLAYPAPWRHRLLGLLAGTAAVQLLNFARIASLFYLGRWSATAFEWAHLYVWQALIMLDVLVVWLLWLGTIRPAR
ncbi:MAG TPA: exosortase H [Usitatibacter sp.]|nr:exosortase H [Usitatibacter sp.]